MIARLLTWYDRKVGLETVAAHCDIPCKIYDPISAQIAAVPITAGERRPA